MSKKDIIAQLWNQSMYDYDHTSANLERFYDASRADLEQRLSEADKVIALAKDSLGWGEELFAEGGINGWNQFESRKDKALAAIKAYEEDQPDSTHNHTSKEVREHVERREPRIGTLERKEWQEDENRKARALLDAIPIREGK